MMRRPCPACGRPAKFYTLVDGEVCWQCPACEHWNAKLAGHRDLTSSEYDELQQARKGQK